jgi:TolA protein
MKTLREYIDRLDEISRRDFLKGAGATAGLAAMGAAKGQETPGLYGTVDREEQLARLRATAAAEGGWGAKVAQKVKPLIVFNPATVEGNPAVIIQVDLAPDGKILNITTLKSSGYRSWDAAVLTALDRAESLPKDANGRIPQRTIKLTFKPY